MGPVTISGASPRPRRTWVQTLQRLLFASGAVLLVIYFLALADSVVSSRLALRQFAAAQASQVKPAAGSTDIDTHSAHFALGLWSVERMAAYRSSLALDIPHAEATLSIPRLDYAAPVFEGTDDLTLNRGLGRIIGTAAFGGPGNIGIAGHRDGFFRVLKDVQQGDSIEITTVEGRSDYVVDRITVVDPGDVQVLQPGGAAELTLITCYPFYFVGNAPHRYVVQASRVGVNRTLN